MKKNRRVERERGEEREREYYCYKVIHAFFLLLFSGGSGGKCLSCAYDPTTKLNTYIYKKKKGARLFWCFHNPPSSDMDYMIFIVRMPFLLLI